MGDLFVSKDGRATAVAVELAPDPDRPAERVPQLVRDVFGAFEEAGFPADGLHRAGFPVVVSEVVEQTYFNMSRIFPFSLVILLVAVWVMFRRFLPVLITGGVALIAVVWMMAFSVLLDRHVTIMASGMPAIILIIAFSDVIHLCSAYLTEVTNGHPRDRAVRRSCTEVGAACMLTSITTFFGFISMSLVPAPAFRILGMSLGFGVGVALLLAMTVTPVLLSWLPEPKPWRRGAAGGVQGALDRLLELCARLATDRPVLVTVAFGLLLLASGVGMSLLTIETEFAKRLSGDNRVNQDAVWLDERLAGSHVLEVYVETEEDGGLLAPDAFVKIAALQDGTGEVKGVDRTLSLVDLVREVHRHVAPPGTPAERGIPTTPGALAQYLLLFEMSGGERLDQLVDFGRRSMRISVRLEDGRFREAARIGEEVRRLAKETLGEGLTVEPAGLQYLLGDWLDELLAGQRRGLGFAFGAVALMMILGRVAEEE